MQQRTSGPICWVRPLTAPARCCGVSAFSSSMSAFSSVASSASTVHSDEKDLYQTSKGEAKAVGKQEKSKSVRETLRLICGAHREPLGSF